MVAHRVEPGVATRRVVWGIAVAVGALFLLAPALGVVPWGLDVGHGGASVERAAAPALPRPLSSGPVPPQVLATLKAGRGPVAELYDPGNGYVYVVNSISNNVTVYAGTTVVGAVGLSTANLTVGEPVALAYDAANGYVYVVDRYQFEAVGGALSILDGTALVTALPLGLQPAGAAYDADDGLVYVTETGAHAVAVVSGTTVTQTLELSVGSAPGAIAYDALDATVYVANYGAANVTEIDASGIVGSVPAGAQPDGLVVNAATGAVDVTNNASNNVTVVAGGSVVGNVPVGTNPRGGVFDPANGYVYVTNVNSSNVSVLAGVGRVATVPVASGPVGASYDASDQLVFVPGSGANSVTIVNGTTASATVAVGAGPSTSVFDPSDADVYVANSNSANVSVLATAYALTFQESGLPSGSLWSVTVGARSANTTTAAILFGVLPGSWAYAAHGPAGYRIVSESPGSPVTVTGSAVTVAIDFGRASSATYTLTFVESGLSTRCMDTTPEWNVTVGNVTESTTGSSISFTEANGTYAYTVGAPAGYTVVSESPGSPVTVNGTSVTVSVEFGRGTPSRLYDLTFLESGLSWGTTWCVEVGGATSCSVGGSIELTQLSAGSYSFSVVPVDGYTASPSSGTVTIVDHSVEVRIQFSSSQSHHCGGGGGGGGGWGGGWVVRSPPS